MNPRLIIAVVVLLVVAGMTSCSSEQKQPAKSKSVPVKTPAAKDPTEKEKAIAAIVKLGGKVTLDEKQPGKPVVRVILYGPEVTDAGLVHLKGFAKLEELILIGTEVTDAGLVHLKGLTNLKSLALGFTEVTDAGLVYLKGLTKLEYLGLCNVKVTEAGEKELQKALPNCRTGP